MTLIFYGHPFSSYTWKVLIALYEKGLDFDYRALENEAPFTHYEQLKGHWPVGQFPLIVHDGTPWFESSVIIEYLDRLAAEPRMIPQDPGAALRVRLLDRSPHRLRIQADTEEVVLAPVVAANITVLELDQAVEPAEMTRLSVLETGESAEVVALAVSCRGAQRRRLLDLGVVPGTRITHELRGPSGDPTAYRIRGALIALRQEQAAQIYVQKRQEASA